MGGRFSVWLAVAGRFFLGGGSGDFLERTGALSDERGAGPSPTLMPMQIIRAAVRARMAMD
jgi:hypothetical protein